MCCHQLHRVRQGLHYSLQWAYGKQTELDDDQLRQQFSLPRERQQDEFLRLLSSRGLAEDGARTAKARLTMSKLKNTSIRQSLRQYSMAQPVMLWRKFLPHKGRKGGHRHTQRPRWVGPGRVVFHELVPSQSDSDRKQILWVILGNIMYRASVHSVRPLSEREQALLEASDDGSSRWKELKDMIPSRNYVDVVGEEHPAEVEEPHLPPQPDGSTVIPPKIRFHSKFHMDGSGLPVVPLQPLPDDERQEGGNAYDIPSSPDIGDTEELGTDLRTVMLNVWKKYVVHGYLLQLQEPLRWMTLMAENYLLDYQYLLDYLHLGVPQPSELPMHSEMHS